MKYLAFSLGTHRAALDCSRIMEILPFMRLERPPTMPDAILGLLPQQDRTVPVVDLNKLFGKSDKFNKLTAHIVVTDLDGSRLAYLVERVTGFLDIDGNAAIAVASDETFNGCVTACHDSGGEVFHILDPDRVLSSLEQERIDAFRSTADKRLKSLERKVKKTPKAKRQENGKPANDSDRR